MSFQFPIGGNDQNKKNENSGFTFPTKLDDTKSNSNTTQTPPFNFDFLKSTSNASGSNTTFKSSFDLPKPPASASDSNAKQSALPKFSFNFSNTSASTPDSNTTQNKPFNFDFNLPKPSSITSDSNTKQSAIPKLSFNFSNTSASTPDSNTTQNKPFNFDFNLPKQAITQKFTFGTGKEFQAEKIEFCPGASKSITNAKANESAQDADTADEIKDGFSEAEKTGEEGEELLLDTVAKLHQLSKVVIQKDESSGAKKSDSKEKEETKLQYCERGVGPLHFNYNKEHKYYRIILRRKQIGTLVLNQRVFPEMNPKKQTKNKIQFLGQLTPSYKSKDDGKKDDAKKEEQNDNENKLDILLLTFRDEETADKFLSLLQKAIDESK